MPRKSSGFVNKRPHKKSRGGCTICKRKKVKCDEQLPQCSYCAQRKIECAYAGRSKPTSITKRDSAPSKTRCLDIPAWLFPSAHTSSGQLTQTELELLYLYKARTWETITVTHDVTAQRLNRDWVPARSISHDYLLYAILSMTAAHSHAMSPSSKMDSLAHIYRHRMIAAYSSALNNISNEEYEPIVVTAKYMYCLVPPPEDTSDATALLDWVAMFLSMAQGLRVLCSLKWACGIKKMDIWPLVRRDDYHSHRSTALFLPPTLEILYSRLILPDNSGTFDYNCPTLISAVSSLRPLFISLHSDGLSSDFYQRLATYPTYLPAEFPQLVRMREPRAMIIMAWWFALLTLLPESAWWFRGVIPHVLDAVRSSISMSDYSDMGDPTKGAFKIAESARTMGREAAATAVFGNFFGLPKK